MTALAPDIGADLAAPSARGRRLLGGAALLLLTRLVGLAMGLAVMVLSARTLGPQRFGTFAFALALVQIGMSVTDLGLGALLVREGAAAPDQLHSLLAWCIRTRALTGALVAAVLAVIAVASIPAGDRRVAALLIIATLPVTAFWLGFNALQHFGLLRRLAWLLFAQSVAWLGVVGWLAARHAGLVAFALAYLIYSICYAALVHLVAHRSVRTASQPVRAGAFWRLLRGVVPLSATVVLIAVYYRLDSVFVYRLSGPEAAGAYAVAYRFLDQAHALPITLSAVFLPLLSAERAAKRPTAPVFTRYLRVSLLTSVPCVAVGLIVAKPLVLRVFGPDFQSSVVLLRLLLLSFVPICVGYVLGQVAIVHHQSRRQLAAAALALVVNVTLNSIYIPLYGPRAAAVITLVTEIAVSMCIYLTLRTPCGLQLPLAWLARLSAVTLLAGTVGILLMRHPWVAAPAFTVAFVVLGLRLRLLDATEIRLLLPSSRRHST